MSVVLTVVKSADEVEGEPAVEVGGVGSDT
jgi:hypothetical protein